MPSEPARNESSFEFEIGRLNTGLSPRLGDRDRDHAQALANCFDDCPPILVQRNTSTVVDGVHRLLAAHILGRNTIAVRYFDGTREEAFAEAIRSNIAHGKPLTLTEREHAAVELLKMGSEWSDRRIGSVCGLSDKTVGRLRRTTAEIPQLSERVGRDGRIRPTDSGKRRADIAAAIRSHPDAKAEEIARSLSTSPTTVRDVRGRLQKGETPVPQGRGPRSLPTSPISRSATDGRRRAELPDHSWSRDRAISSMPDGNDFSEWLDQTKIAATDWIDRIQNIPLGRLPQLAEEAQLRAEHWAEFAAALEERARALSRRSRS
jgi:ParB-like chromosome segregation protein Spo0J